MEEQEFDLMGAINAVMKDASEEGQAELNAEPTPKKEAKPVKETQEPKADAAKQESEEDEDLDFGNMPNGQIRYQKQKEQLQKERERLKELEAIAEKEATARKELEAKLAELKEIEETSGLTEEQKLAYATNKRIQELEALLAEAENKQIESKNASKEDIFWSAHPELTESADVKKEVSEKMFEFLQANRGMMQDVFEDRLSLDHVLKLIDYELPVKKVAVVQDPKKVFATVEKQVSSKYQADETDEFTSANDRLSKGYDSDAVEAMNKAITARIFGLGG